MYVFLSSSLGVLEGAMISTILRKQKTWWGLGSGIGQGENEKDAPI